MFLINKENIDATRIGQVDPLIESGASSSMPPLEHDDGDATRRIKIDSTEPAAPQQPVTPRRPAQPTAEQQRRARNTAERKRRERNLILILCAIAAVLLIAVIVVVATVLMKDSGDDDDKILNNVFAAGVNLSGMTKEEARTALEKANRDTFQKLDMAVQVVDETIYLSAKDTGANLDVNAVVEAAYAYGHTGSQADRLKAENQSQSTPHHVSVLPYLSLDTTYIRDRLNDLGNKYSTVLSQPSYYVEGQKPSASVEVYDPNITYQTLYINLGTAEYGLVIDDLYQQVMDAYDANLWQVTAKCEVTPPKALDYEALIQELCTPAVNASIELPSYNIIKEVYGYGFTEEELTNALSGKGYGDIVTVPMHYIAPEFTADNIAGDLFRDELSVFSTILSTDVNWNRNMELAIGALNGDSNRGLIVESGAEFSFNAILGQLTVQKGYKSVMTYVGRSMQEVVGGGVCQVASTLYAALLEADLEILERTSHSFVTDFIAAGLDAEVIYGSVDLRFRNNTEQPILIKAEIVNNAVQITIIGTDNRDYTVDIECRVNATEEPNTVYNTMVFDNPGGYVDGAVLVEGIAGTNVSVYRIKTHKETLTKISEDLLGDTYYSSRDQVVVKIDPSSIPVVPDPDNPTPDPELPPVDPENPTIPPVDPNLPEDGNV